MAQVISSEEFNNLVQNTEGIAVVDFFATWCGPCKMLAPVLEGLSEKMDKVTFYKVNVDASSDLAGRYGIQAIPNLVIFKDGKAVDQITGFVPEGEIVSRLEKVF